MKFIFSILFLVFFSSTSLHGKVVLPSVLSSNMVLQQGSTVRFWGSSNPLTKVTLKVSWDNRTYVADSDASGKWSIVLDTPSAGGPYQIIISDGEELVLDDVLIGEVWLCSGQSNMEMPVKGFRGQPVEGSHETIMSAYEKRQLRMFTVKRAHSRDFKEDVEGRWLKNNSEAVSEVSAAAYYFADALQKKLDIPVGIICSSWSASVIEAWMGEEALHAFPEFKDKMQRTDISPAATPSALFNAMIKPLENYVIKGMIWYQGEANIFNPDLYKRLFHSWLQQNRKLFRLPQMPVYYVEIAPYLPPENMPIQRALFKEMQMELMEENDFIGMASTADLGDPKFIHPSKKKEVGERLAYWALAKTYGLRGFDYCGPLLSSHVLKGNKLELTFRYAENGLIPELEPIVGFEAAGTDGVFVSVPATIVRGTARVEVNLDGIQSPKEVRYCFKNYQQGNLKNNAGLPAIAFRVKL